MGANRTLRAQLNAECAKLRVRVYYPELSLCTDNGAMIALATAMRLQSGRQQASEVYAFDVKPRWPLDQEQVVRTEGQQPPGHAPAALPQRRRASDQAQGQQRSAHGFGQTVDVITELRQLAGFPVDSKSP